MAWSLGNVGTNISGIFKEDPAEKATHDFLKETVFNGEIGFSAGQDFSDDRAQQILDLRIAKMFRGTPQDKIPKSFTEDQKKELVQKLLGADFDAAPDAAKSYLMEKVSDIVGDRFEDKWYQSAGNWIKDTAAPAVGSAAATINSLSPVGLMQIGIGRGSGFILNTFPGLKDETSSVGKALKTMETSGQEVAKLNKEAREDIGGFFVFAATNKARAWELARQGGTNALTSTAGLVWDTLRFATYDCVGKGIIGNAAIGIYNIGQDEASKAEYLGTGKWLRHTEWLNKNTQFAAPIKVTHDDLTPNTNANYERIFLYGPQAIVEVGAVVVTGGGAAAAWGLARGSAIAARTAVVATETATAAGATATTATAAATTAATTTTATTAAVAAEATATATRGTAQTIKTLQQIKNLDAIADANKVFEKLDKAQDALDRAKVTLAQAQEAREALAMQQAATAGAGSQTAVAGQSGNFSSLMLRQAENRVVKAEQAVEKAEKRVESAQRIVDTDPKLAERIAKIKESGVTTGDYTQSTAETLARAQSGTPTLLDRVMFRTNPEKLAQQVGKNAADAERVGAQVADASGVLNIGNPSAWQIIGEEVGKGWYKGVRFTNPLRDGVVGKAVNVAGVGLSFGFGMYASQQEAKVEKADAKKTGDSARVAIGVDIPTLEAQLANVKALEQSITGGLPTYVKGSTIAPSETIAVQPPPPESVETERVAGNFNTNGSKGAPSSDPTALQGNSTAFNNRADGTIYIKIDENSLSLLKSSSMNGIASTGKSPTMATGNVS